MTNRFQEITLQRLHSYSYVVLGHLALIYLVVTLQWQMLLIAWFMQFFITHLGISMMYHRCVSHNSVKLPKWLEIIGLIFGGLSFQGSAISWAATHRQHHQHMATDKDPHSPKHMGSLYIQTFSYTFSKIDFRSAAKLLRTNLLFWHKYYYHIFVPVLILALVFLPFNLALALFFAPISLSANIVNLVNTWTHAWNKDIPTDTPWSWIFIGGEAWHKVHHDHPSQLVLHRYDYLGRMLAKLNQK